MQLQQQQQKDAYFLIICLTGVFLPLFFLKEKMKKEVAPHFVAIIIINILLTLLRDSPILNSKDKPSTNFIKKCVMTAGSNGASWLKMMIFFCKK